MGYAEDKKAYDDYHAIYEADNKRRHSELDAMRSRALDVLSLVLGNEIGSTHFPDHTVDVAKFVVENTASGHWDGPEHPRFTKELEKASGDTDG